MQTLSAGTTVYTASRTLRLRTDLPFEPIKGSYGILHCNNGNRPHVFLSKPKCPSLKTMEKWTYDGVAKSVDGCKVEPDGTCPHGTESWLRVMGII